MFGFRVTLFWTQTNPPSALHPPSSPAMLLSLALLPLTLAAMLPKATSSFHLPLKVLESHQHSDDLSQRQAWLINQAKSMRAKYEPYLNKRGRELLKRDRMEKREEQMKREHTTMEWVLNDSTLLTCWNSTLAWLILVLTAYIVLL